MDWDSRLSVAVSDGAASFSELHGVDRELVLLRGVGLILRFADGEGLVRNRSGIARSWTADEPFEALELEVAIARYVRDTAHVTTNR